MLWVPDPAPEFPIPLPPGPRVEFLKTAENLQIALPLLEVLVAAIDSLFSQSPRSLELAEL
jgi:hypothetical protein